MVYTSEQIMNAINGLKKEISKRRNFEEMLQEFQHISVNEARKVLNTTHKAIYKLVNDNKLQATNVNGVPKILAKSLMDYIEQNPHRFPQAENKPGRVIIPENSCYTSFIAQIKKQQSEKGSHNGKGKKVL